MAFGSIKVTNGLEIKDVPLGFSWTTFFFGCIPAFCRGDWISGSIIFSLAFFTLGFSNIIAAFLYNKMYARSLFERGYIMYDYCGLSEEQIKNSLGYIHLPV